MSLIESYCCRAFGLGIRSFLPLPELWDDGDAPAAVDVEIERGPVPRDLEDAVHRGVRYDAAPDRLLLRVDHVARYLITDGCRITVERASGSEDDTVRLFLLGSALGALLHQRGDLVLHASAIAVGTQAVAFAGEPGVGKSTLATAFSKRGYPLLTDDVCVLRAGPEGTGPLMAQPGFTHVKLWPDSLAQLEIDGTDLRRIRRRLEKRILSLDGRLASEPLPLRRLYLLRQVPDDVITIEPLSGPEKFNALKNNTYRLHFLGGLGTRPRHFDETLALAQQATVSTVSRPTRPFRLDELVTALEADLHA